LGSSANKSRAIIHGHDKERPLPEAQAREVLYFVAFFKSRLPRNKSTQQDVSACDRFGAVCEWQFSRDELYG
jgi:hypothetical protein